MIEQPTNPNLWVIIWLLPVGALKHSPVFVQIRQPIFVYSDTNLLLLAQNHSLLALSLMKPSVDVMRLLSCNVTSAMSLENRFCFSRKDGTGEVGGVHPMGANSMAISGLSFRETLVGTG